MDRQAVVHYAHWLGFKLHTYLDTGFTYGDLEQAHPGIHRAVGVLEGLERYWREVNSEVNRMEKTPLEAKYAIWLSFEGAMVETLNWRDMLDSQVGTSSERRVQATLEAYLTRAEKFGTTPGRNGLN